MGERVLGYGKSWQNRSFVCVSELAGLTCKNRSGHGFSLSRERSTLVAPGGTVAGSAKVVIATEIFEDLAEWQARPLTINLAMGSRYSIDKLRWASWGGTEARASGFVNSQTPADVVAFDKRACVNGVTAYTKMRITVKGKAPNVQNLLCG